MRKGDKMTEHQNTKPNEPTWPGLSYVPVYSEGEPYPELWPGCWDNDLPKDENDA